MSAQTAEPIVSSLPLASFLVPLVAGALVLLAKKLPRWVWQGFAILACLATLGIGIAMAQAVSYGAILTTWGNQLRVDGLSALMVILIGGIGFLASIYSIKYVTQSTWINRVGQNIAQHRLWIFYWLLLWFIATMVWGCVTNNVIMLYVAVEATTLTSGLLVAFYWDRKALEAGYKYLMLLTIGLTFALFGCVLIYASAAATKKLTGSDSLLLSEIIQVAQLIPSRTAMIIVAFLVVGFGTKAGIAPFHPWLPDAHAEAPTPISVLLSGVMIKMSVYALARTSSMFFPTWSQITLFLVALGTFTMLLGIIMAFTQDDLKRLLAYSSVSQIGYIIVGIGLGTYLGCYGGLFHLLNHAIFKALLFMCAGAVIYSTGLRNISQLGGLHKKMPITSVCFCFGALAIAGFPPFNGFFSKLTIYFALAKAGIWWALVIALFTAVLTMVVLIRVIVMVFWGTPKEAIAAQMKTQTVQEIPVAMWGPMVILAGTCVLLGIFYWLPHHLLNNAAIVLATLGK